jgi:hypothetical protein
MRCIHTRWPALCLPLAARAVRQQLCLQPPPIQRVAKPTGAQQERLFTCTCRPHKLPRIAGVQCGNENSVRALLLTKVLNAGRSIEVCILGPGRCTATSYAGEHHAVRHCNAVFDAEASGVECRGSIEVNDAPLFRDGDGAQGFIFAALLAHALEHFEEGKCRDD